MNTLFMLALLAVASAAVSLILISWFIELLIK